MKKDKLDEIKDKVLKDIAFVAKWRGAFKTDHCEHIHNFVNIKMFHLDKRTYSPHNINRCFPHVRYYQNGKCFRENRFTGRMMVEKYPQYQRCNVIC